MINLDNIINDNNNNHNQKQHYIPDHPYVPNLINKQKDIDKIYLHAKD